MNELLGYIIVAIASFFLYMFIDSTVLRSKRPPVYTDQPFKRPCKHEGGFCKDPEMFKECPPDDPTQKVICWSSGVFENDPTQHDIQVDLGKTGRSP